ncbi:hypothetical protein [Flavobacterium sharifuzzamanii]|uniref:hypothetical protein n=1 Tax=Flavobacterium sharifuzzamanii TaxID=2211133 RepID=UPI000DADD3B1|nr:hypothetical protein [Flavobacterium sharifuzzamanii]KAF2081742.1 hypothetical protein DMA14_08060 [Flavobacterium sharifuzzamanii]
MSINLKVARFIAMISFLLIFGVQENGVPTIALLLIYFYQFLNDLFSSMAFGIFWEGLSIIPVFFLLILFLISRNYKVLLGCFVLLLVYQVYVTGLVNNYQNIHSAFLLPLTVFVISSIYVIAIVKKQKRDIKVS